MGLKDADEPQIAASAAKPTRQRSWAEPWKVKVVEPIRMLTREQRHVEATQALEKPSLRNSVVELGMQAPPGSNQKKTPAVSSRSRARLILLDKDV